MSARTINYFSLTFSCYISNMHKNIGMNGDHFVSIEIHLKCIRFIHQKKKSRKINRESFFPVITFRIWNILITIANYSLFYWDSLEHRIKWTTITVISIPSNHFSIHFCQSTWFLPPSSPLIHEYQIFYRLLHSDSVTFFCRGNSYLLFPDIEYETFIFLFNSLSSTSSSAKRVYWLPTYWTMCLLAISAALCFINMRIIKSNETHSMEINCLPYKSS